jgi:hypothetical protein
VYAKDTDLIVTVVEGRVAVTSPLLAVPVPSAERSAGSPSARPAREKGEVVLGAGEQAVVTPASRFVDRRALAAAAEKRVA